MVQVIHGDCLEVLRGMADCSVDSIVTDPPYGLSFMGKRWDYDVPGVEVWSECLRVLKPGGHLLAFAGTRTQHRMAVRIEDAGFEIRDMIAWVYGSGFPKSLDVSKAIDQRERGAMVRAKLLHFAQVRGIDGKWLESHGVASAASFTDWTVGGHVPSDKNWQLVKLALGVTPDEEAAFERGVIGHSSKPRPTYTTGNIGGEAVANEYDITAPATEAASQWEGWGTALKPALEPITVARKPLIGTVAENVLAHGTGGLNIDGCRVEAEVGGRPLREVAALRDDVQYSGNALAGRVDGSLASSRAVGATDLGRWPANLIHDGSEEVVGLFPDSKGQQGDVRGTEPSGVTDEIYGKFAGRVPAAKRGDSGSAARFFYCAKASKKDRNEGLDPVRFAERPAFDNEDGSMGSRSGPRRNYHPTVKPTDLMRYLCRLVTPPSGTVLDPFAGSGSTGKAAVMEGFSFIGIEREAEYVEIARARIAYAEQAGDDLAEKGNNDGQLSLFSE